MNLKTLFIFYISAKATSAMLETNIFQKSKVLESKRDHSPDTDNSAIVPVLSTFDLEVTFTTIQLNFASLRKILKSFFEGNTLEFKRYHEISVMLRNTIKQLEVSDTPSVLTDHVTKALKTMKHELACMDETISCINSKCCGTSAIRLFACISFSLEAYMTEIRGIHRDLQEILCELGSRKTSESSPGITVAQAKYSIEDLKSRFTKVRDIGTDRWTSGDELALFSFIVDDITRTFDKADVHLHEYEESHLVQRNSSSTESTGSDILRWFATLLINVEAELLELMNPVYLSPAALKQSISVQREIFHHAVHRVTEMGLKLTDELESRIYKIDNLLALA